VKEKNNIKKFVLWGLPILAICLLVGVRLAITQWENTRNKGHTFIPVDDPTQEDVFISKARQYEPLIADRVGPGAREGVRIFDGSKWATYTEENSSLPDNYVSTTAFDHEGRAWVATTHKINILERETWVIYSRDETGVKGLANAIAFDSDGNAWVGGDGSISIFDGKKWDVYSIGNYAGKEVEAIDFDEQGRAWIGYGEYAYIFDGKVWESFKLDSSGNTFVDDIAVDSEGQVWISWKPKPNRVGLTGISIFDLDEFEPESSEFGHSISRFLGAWGDWHIVMLLGFIWSTFIIRKQDDLGILLQLVLGAISGLLTSNILVIWFGHVRRVDMGLFIQTLLLGIPFGSLGAIIFCKVIQKNARIAVLGGIIGGIVMMITPCRFIVGFLFSGGM